MKEFSLQQAKLLKLEVIEVIEVPGAFEIPFATQKLLEKQDIQAVATLGVVIKGDTAHDEVIVNSVTKNLLDLAIKHKKPVSLGIIGPNATYQQAQDRKLEYAKRSIQSVAEQLQLNRKL